ncbi:MAG: D-aminoacyl-tRNA deacylase [Planctomycetia bacterium]|nr:D-aminoacyl-tRNA deacylase [Planctomycetia bacterium]
MRACIQRVKSASVSLPDQENRLTGQISNGLLVLLGVGVNDSEKEAKFLAQKVSALRIFDDENGKMNLELSQVGGSMLVVSQFTLFADCVHGKRPSFIDAAPPNMANDLYQSFVDEVRKRGIPVETGVFRQNMAVELLNDGPVTIWMDTDFLQKKRTN